MFKILIPLMLSLSLVGCDNKPTTVTPASQPVAQTQQPATYQEAPQQQPQVVVVQQPTQQQNDSTGSLLTGMVLGHMMSNHGGYSRNNTTIVNKTVVRPRSYYGSSSNRYRTNHFTSSRSFSKRR